MYVCVILTYIRVNTYQSHFFEHHRLDFMRLSVNSLYDNLLLFISHIRFTGCS
jgi:hypothetical protein